MLGRCAKAWVCHDFADLVAFQRGYASIVIQGHVHPLGVRELVLESDKKSCKTAVQVRVIYLSEGGAPPSMKQHNVPARFDAGDHAICAMSAEPIKQHDDRFAR